MLGVEPDCLIIERRLIRKIHYRVGAVNAIESKEVANLGQLQKFAVVLRRPAQQTEKIDERWRQKACIAIGGHAYDGTVLALGKFGAVGRDEQGKMREMRRGSAQAFKNEQVLEGVGQVILAANDVADAEIG